MSQFKPYPAYKDSGVEWLGEVPDHWSVRKVSIDFTATKGHRGALLTKEYCLENPGKYPVYSGQTENHGVLGEIADFDFDLGVEGAILSTTVGAKAMSVIYVSGRVSLSQNCMIIRPIGRSVVAKFFFYHFQPLFLLERKMIPDHMQPSFRMEDLYSFRVAVPPHLEQTQIARFLDYETARIDALIEEQKRLIELLKEKRQAVISHAVTKGLDPTVPMKDSGVEWLGEVPAHWVVSQLKFNTLEMQTGPFGSQLHAEDYVDGGIPLINPAHMINGQIVADPQVSVDKETWLRLKRHALATDDIIFARRGELGRCAIVTPLQEGWLCGTGSLKAKLNSRLDAEYAYLLITSKGAVAELSLESKGSTMENLNTETLGRVRLPLPSVSEQKTILNYVHQVSGQFKALIDTAETTTTLISERRSALISAAVTGKIDVRSWQPPTDNHAPSTAAQKTCLETV